MRNVEVLTNQFGILVGPDTLDQAIWSGDPSILVAGAQSRGINVEGMVHALEAMNYDDKVKTGDSQFATIQNMFSELSLKATLMPEEREAFASYIVENPSLLEPETTYMGLGMYNNTEMLKNVNLTQARKM